MEQREKVVVAMSGGVDSSVAAVMLREQGFDVIGIMLRLWSEPGKERENRCCTPDSMMQARRVAAKLDIPFYVVDAKDVFRAAVVQYFLDAGIPAVKAVVFLRQAGCNAAHDLVSQLFSVLFAVAAVDLR